MKSLLILLLIIAALAQQTHAQQVYQSPANGFAITYPADWTIETFSEGSTEVKGKLGLNDVFVTVKEDKSFKGKTINDVANSDFRGALLEQYQTLFTNLEVVKDEFTTFNGHSAYYFCYKCDLFGDYRLYSHQYFLVSQSRLYCVTATSTVDEYPKAECTFNAILSSFTLN